MAENIHKTYKKSGRQSNVTNVSSNDNVVWILGFVMLAFGVFATVSVISHFFNWTADVSAILNDESTSGVSIPYENICSGVGARVAYWVVDCLFGVFGIIIPIVLTVLGWRIFRKNKLNINHFALSGALILVMGSVTMGLIDVKTNFMHDLGGRLGVMCAADLSDALGFGVILVLIVGWILTGVFINHNFIRTVNKASDKMVDKSEKIFAGVKDMVASRRNASEENVSESVVAEQPAAEESSNEMGSMQENEYVIPKPEPEPQVAPATENEFTITPQYRNAEEQPMTMNDYLAAKRASEIGEPNMQSEFGAEPAGVAASANSTPSSYDDDGCFTVVSNVAPAVNDIDVDKLLNSDVEADADADAQSQTEPIADEDGFVVIPSQRGGGVTNSNLGANEVKKVVSSSDDEFVVTPQGATPAEDEAEKPLVINVYEHKPRVVDEDTVDEMELYDPLRDLEHYKKPYVSLLEDYQSPHKVGSAEIYDNKCRIQETLKYFGIPIVDIDATVGPTVTLYEIKQAQGVKISKIQGLEKDIAQSLRAQGIRIIAPIPGRGTIGIEVPNRDKQIVSMYSSICSEKFQQAKMELPVVIGRTIQNENFIFDLAKLPHLLVAGATGQGKSVGLNAIITSLLYTKHPAQLKFVMIDPKMVEFSVYNKLERHFLAKMESEDESIITEPKKAVCVLNSLVEEMGRRLELLKLATARNIVEYNEKFTERRLNPQKGHRYLPYIVVIIDEFADLIMTAKEVEVPVMRLAQKARAVGIHLIIATQRPDVKVITGGIKANFPARIAFRVMQMIDSRTIIDQPGANQLIGRGDMLFSKDGELTRIQCALVETKEVERLVDFISKQQGYTEAYPLPDFDMETGGDGAALGDGESSAPVKYDALFGEVARAAVTNGMISTSSIQRNYEVGFNRAGRIMLQLERAGIVGPQVGAKPREIKFYDLPSLEAKLQSLGVF
ncbi:MAG: DNA translocase FtsK [Alistipes sp.]|nr:DNA translocase FtsK [Alistipes sp.]